MVYAHTGLLRVLCNRWFWGRIGRLCYEKLYKNKQKKICQTAAHVFFFMHGSGPNRVRGGVASTTSWSCGEFPFSRTGDPPGSKDAFDNPNRPSLFLSWFLFFFFTKTNANNTYYFNSGIQHTVNNMESYANKGTYTQHVCV